MERYQFSDLADAINVWLYGTYSNSSNLVYVVNGNIVNDVNAYSIYDIDEITLVQTALAQVSGAGPGQQMVLIKLKTNRPGKQGIEAAGQTSIVNIDNLTKTPGVKTTANIYDQYYLSGYKNFNNASFGLSADYQRDVLPQLQASNYLYIDPFKFNRIKLNGYANANLWRGTTVNFNVNYTPQQSKNIYDYADQFDTPGEADNYYYKNQVTQHLVNSNVTINSKIVTGLTNKLSAAYTHYDYFERDSVAYINLFPSDPTYYDNGFAGVRNKTSNLLIQDNLAYHAKLGVFDFEPTVDFSYRNFKNSIIDSTSTFGFSAAGGIPSYNLARYETEYSSKLYLLTPSLNIYYKDVFNIQGGVIDILNSPKITYFSFSIPHVSPFLTVSLEPLKLCGISTINLRLFGSFSRENQLLTDGYSTLSGFNLSAVPIASESYSFDDNNFLPNFINSSSTTNPFKEFSNYQAGITLGILKNLIFNYSYEDKFYATQNTIETALGPDEYELLGYGYYYNKIIINRIGINYTLKTSNFNWETGLNAAKAKMQVIDYPLFVNDYNSIYLTKGHRYSGGFTNRFTYKTIFAGLDALYQLGSRPVNLDYATSANPPIPPNINSFSLQNLYAGSQFKITHLKHAEAFINCRNIWQNKTSDITDNRRFYGIGFKLDL